MFWCFLGAKVGKKCFSDCEVIGMNKNPPQTIRDLRGKYEHSKFY